MNDLKFPDFSKKLLTVHVIGGQNNYVVDDPRFEKQGERWFLVGNTPKGSSSGNWSEGIAVAIAWDQVSAYRVFDSVEHYTQRYAKFEEVKKKS